MQSLIISIDPGDRYVGIFIRYPDHYDWYQLDTVEMCNEHTKPNDLLYRYVRQAVLNYDELELKNNIIDKHKIMIIEDYINYKHKETIKAGKTNNTSEMIGYLKQLANDWGFEVVMQRAVQAKSWDNQRLERLGILINNGNKHTFYDGNFIAHHTRDALRHFIYYTNKNYFGNAVSKAKLESFVGGK